MKININLSHTKYPIYIGKNVSSKSDKILRSNNINSNKYLFIVDYNVPDRLVKKILIKFKSKEIFIKKILFKEKNKSLKTVENILKLLEDKNFTRNDSLISIGGGICGDVCGFVSNIFKRGIKFINVPTTLLSQVDSSIGGKTGVNTTGGKNMVGTFYQPSIVISDLTFLDTLPKKEIICGYAEILKHSLISDKKFFNYLEKNHKKIFNKDSNHLKKSIFKSCLIKKKIVESDVNESNLRKTLNFGHTFAHAFESTKGYSKNLNHGEAVLLGISAAINFSYDKKILNKKDFKRIFDHLNDLNYSDLNKFFKRKDINKIVSFMQKDKKNKNSLINLILIKSISKPILNGVYNKSTIKKFIQKLIN